jgi:hypothetical protein
MSCPVIGVDLAYQEYDFVSEPRYFLGKFVSERNFRIRKEFAFNSDLIPGLESALA